MSENLVAFSNANLPAVKTLVTSLQNLKNEVGSSGTVILKMDKTGCWVYGADQTEVQEGSLWAVNPFSFVHGFIAWGEGEVLGEKMVPITQPLPELEPSPVGAKKGWEMQIGFMVKCINGEDEGLEARFCTTSVGGKKAVQILGTEIATQVDSDSKNPVPVILLDNEHYQHKKYGRIFTPLMTIKKWIGMEGEAKPAEIAAKSIEQTEAVSEIAATTEAPKTRRRRAPIAQP